MPFDNYKLKKLAIAVIYGGYSKERAGSLISGETALQSLKRRGYNVFSIDPKDKDFHIKILRANVAFLALHGKYGEDGKIQGLLETLNIPYTGSGVLSSALGMNKVFFKNLISSYGIPTPKYRILDSYQNTHRELTNIITELSLPLFIKPSCEGGSLGAGIARSKKDLLKKIENNKKIGYGDLLVEQYIRGRSLTIGIIEKNGNIIVLPPLETISYRDFYDYESKHNHNFRRYECPAKLSKEMTSRLQNTALKIHRLLGCHGFSRIDFIVTGNNEFYVLEINTLPGLSPQSNMAVMAQAAGLTYNDLISAMLLSAFTKPSYLS